ncbi:MAG: hypothetical protein ACK2TV_11125 [Anaerolineales bacterium]
MISQIKEIQPYKRHLVIITTGSLILGALFQAILPVGNFWLGFLAASLLIFVCGIVLYWTWRAVGSERIIAWMMLVAFFLRLIYGVFLSWGLPRFGYEEPPQQAGFVFFDPYRREESAWSLANSDQPITRAFSDTYPADQYGGLLALSALIYRTISPDAYRPALISILAAGAMALSLPFLIAAVRRRFDDRIALFAGWILAFFPEGVLLGSSQMREPFLILFFAIIFWAGVHWLDRSRVKLATILFILSTISLTVLSFRVTLPILSVIGLWLWVMLAPEIKQKSVRIVGWLVLAMGFIFALWFAREWLQAVVHWDTLQTVIRSGQIQFQLEKLPEWLSFPFVLIYGIFQPILPAAIADPAPWIWRSLAILRGLGWYALLPILAYAFFRVWKIKPSWQKRWMIIVTVLSWVWILIASARAGGDQWDNPRYRTIFLPWLAFVASWAIYYAKDIKDHWLMRVFIVEGIFLAFVTEWYLSRYYPVIPRLDFWVMMAIIFILSSVVILSGWIWDRKHQENS